MSYVNTDTHIKFVLTNAGKELGLKHGLSNVLKYFSVSDNGVVYTMDVQPDKFTDLNGTHTTSTNTPSCSDVIINEKVVSKQKK